MVNVHNGCCKWLNSHFEWLIMHGMFEECLLAEFIGACCGMWLYVFVAPSLVIVRVLLLVQPCLVERRMSSGPCSMWHGCQVPLVNIACGLIKRDFNTSPLKLMNAFWSFSAFQYGNCQCWLVAVGWFISRSFYSIYYLFFCLLANCHLYHKSFRLLMLMYINVT